MLKILIPEKIPAHNKGEEAIFRGILKTLDFVPDKKIYLYSKSPGYDGNKYGGDVEIITESLVPDPENSKVSKVAHVIRYITMHIIYALFYRVNKRFTRKIFTKKIWKVYDEMDIVLAAHDSAYAIMHNVLIIFCKLIGKPVAIYGTSILPFLYKKTWVRYLTKICLNRADLITVREEISRDVLVNKIGIKKTLVKLTADKAFLLEPVEKQKAVKLLNEQGVICSHGIIIGVTVVYKTGIFNTLKFDIEKHLHIMASFIDCVIEKTNGTIVFFPHSIGPTDEDDDRIAAQAIYTKCNNKSNIKLITDDFSASELKGMIGCCDFFIGERTHSVIAAVSMLVPAISITHPEDYRTIGILGLMIGIKERIYNVKELSVTSLNQFFIDAWNSRDEIRNHLRKRIPEVIKDSMSNSTFLQMLVKNKNLQKK
ncbi:MAG: pyruv trans protein [Candidatus Brocadiaceae bacterium]|nr:pyruv trans protein [Candidatus Brocadiaceae bacterium]